MKQSPRETFVPILELASRWQEGIEWDSANVTNFTQTSCNGDFASNPIIGVSAAECAAVCDTIHPASSDDYCVAIGHYTMSDMDICFLFKDVKAIWEYNCSYSTAEHEEEDSLVQHKEIGQMAKHKAVPHAAVQKSKKLKLTKRNEEPEDEDEPPYDGPQIQNTCLVRHSWGSNTPFKPSVHKLYRCFGMENPDDGVDGSGELGLHEIHSDDAIHFK
jgi:hypothetical protein